MLAGSGLQAYGGDAGTRDLRILGDDLTPLTPTTPTHWPCTRMGTPPSSMPSRVGALGGKEVRPWLIRVLVDLALASAQRRRAGPAGRDVRGHRQRAIKTLQPQQVAAVVDDS